VGTKCYRRSCCVIGVAAIAQNRWRAMARRRRAFACSLGSGVGSPAGYVGRRGCGDGLPSVPALRWWRTINVGAGNLANPER